MTGFTPFPDNRTEQGHGAQPTAAAQPSYPGGAQPGYVRDAVLPAAIVAAACAGAAAYALLGKESMHVVREVLVAVSVATVLMVAIAYIAARAASRRVAAQVQSVRQVAHRGQAELQQLVDQLMRGEHPAPLVPAPGRAGSASAAGDDPFALLAGEIEQSQYHAGQVVLRVADRVFGGRSDQRVEIFVNLARRMQSLVHREIEMLDDLEAQVEDPDLLKGLFTVDHLATRLRRQSESLAVLGGSASRRQWTRQVTMHEVLRAAVAEVEQYSRVKVVPPVDGVLRGAAVTDVIHLIAELVENATKFSAPHTTALLRAQHVSAGVAIEVEDRGLGMLTADQQRMNDLLADPGRMDVDELLRDGRIGLYVVAALARRHNIRVRLQNNIFGGTQAIVVLPKALLDQSDRGLPYAAGAGATAGAGASGGGEDNGSARLALVPTGVASTGGMAAPAGTSSVASPVRGGVTAQQAGTAPGLAPAPPLVPLPARRPASGAANALGEWAIDPNSDDDETPDSYRADFGRPQQDAVPRPPLPKRQGQTNFTPQPPHRSSNQLSGQSAARSTEPPADQMPGLMADFLRGVSRAEEENPPHGTDSRDARPFP
jgi:signal transduction histidine kinase